jgi:phage FluMu gp28-like protein
MKQATRAWKNAGAVTMLQGLKLRVVSTPNGVGNEFHNTWRIATDPDYSPGDMPKATWSAHEIPIEKAIEQGYPVDIEKCWAIAQGDKRIFDQEFRCSFLDNAFQYIATEAIDEATFDEAWEENDMVDYFAGLDIGRVVDRTVLIIVQSLRGVAKVWRVRTFKRTDTALLHKIVGELFSDVHPKRLCIDSTGLGAMVSEDLQKKHSQKFVPANQRPRVELVEFTPKSKEALATGLFTAITNKTLLLPMNDENLAVAPEHVGVARQLRREVASIRRVITDAANVRYETPHTSEGHGDHAWALALANYARTAPNPLFAAVMGNLSKPTPAAP